MSRACAVVVFYISITVFTLTSRIFAKSTQYCPINSTNKTELREPIILINSTGKLEFYIPSLHNGKLIFDQDQKFILSCPNPRNLLTISSGNVTTGQCTNGKLRVVGKALTFQELSCNKSIRGDVKRRDDMASCGIKGNQQGSLIDIGFNVDVMSGRRRQDFITLIQVCHNLKKGLTYYSEHILLGKLMKQASSSKFRPGFSTQGVQVSAAVAYKQSYQKSTFTKLLGASLVADNYINNKSFLSRGHLAPDADFLFAPWQFSTYFYLNAAPQWQVVNGGNWHKVESMVRKLAGQLESDLRIFTGTHGILTLPNSQSVMTEMYMLPKEVLPIPKLFWKLVYVPKTKEAIILVGSNNPFLKHAREVDRICEDVCDHYGWTRSNWTRVDRGVVYCCDYHSFIKIVTSSPELDVRGVLQGPK